MSIDKVEVRSDSGVDAGDSRGAAVTVRNDAGQLGASVGAPSEDGAAAVALTRVVRVGRRADLSVVDHDPGSHLLVDGLTKLVVHGSHVDV